MGVCLIFVSQDKFKFLLCPDIHGCGNLKEVPNGLILEPLSVCWGCHDNAFHGIKGHVRNRHPKVQVTRYTQGERTLS